MGYDPGWEMLATNERFAVWQDAEGNILIFDKMNGEQTKVSAYHKKVRREHGRKARLG